MALLTAQQQDWFSRMGQLRTELLETLNEMELRVAEYDFNNFGGLIADADIQETFPALNQSDMFNAVSAVNAIIDAFGDQTSGSSHYASLVKFEV